MSARIMVVPPSTEVGEIAREMAPAGFELVLARNVPEIEADFTQWMKDNIDKLPVNRAAVQEYIALREKAAKK